MSDLLEQASLVMIPSGYKEDVVYSQIPLDGSGDLQLTRASNGTRINSDGNVEVCPWNILSNSEQFSSANSWFANTTGGSTASQTSDYGVAPNGTTTADRIQLALNGGSFADWIIAPTLPIIVGQVYTYSIYIKSLSGTPTINFLNNGSANIPKTLTTEWVRYKYSWTATSATIYPRFQLSTGTSSSADILAWGYQLNIGSTAKPYFPTTDRLNVPRLTYQNGGGGCPSLLLEKQSTNVLLRSEEFDSASWTKNGATITANTVTSPDGTQNADTLTGASGSYRIYQIVSGLSSVDYTFSVFAKKGTANLIWFDFVNVGDGPSFNFTTKAWSSASGWTTSYEEHANGWFRLIATKASNTTSAGLGIKVGAVNETVYLYGAQMEASSYKTSYIQTTSSSATRVADACFKTGISSLIGQTEGVLFVDINYISHEAQSILAIEDWVANSTVIRILADTSTSIGAQVFTGGNQYVATFNSAVNGQRYKCALAYKNNDFAFYVNGTQVSTSSSGSVPLTSNVRFGAFLSGQVMDGQINQAVLFKTRLTNTQLAQLTA